MDAITVVGVCRSFGERRVLVDFRASFPIGGITAVVGESGIGKTTLLNIMMGLIAPDSGRIEGAPKRMSAVFQEDRLISHLTVAENVALGSACRLDPRTVAAHLDALGLAGSMDAPVRSLSGGMKRRTAVARAYLAQSDVVYMDEPFASLDRNNIERVISYILDKRAGRTVILSLHERRYAEMLGARIVEIERLQP